MPESSCDRGKLHRGGDQLRAVSGFGKRERQQSVPVADVRRCLLPAHFCRSLLHLFFLTNGHKTSVKFLGLLPLARFGIMASKGGK